MRREHLEHLIRACADLTGDDHIVVIGSQAIASPDVLGARATDLPVEGSTRDAIAGRLGALGL